MSIKFLEVADFHVSPDTIEQNKKNGKVVKKHTENVDFIACAGDFFDSPMYATDKGGYNEAKKIISDWASIAPVCVVEGTPSHDGAGCYDGLPVTVLQPGKVYGYWDSVIEEINKESIADFNNPSAILFGFPEANKKNIVARFGLSAEEANKKAEQLLEQYIREWVAPMRSKYPNIPAVGLFHGNITDSECRENETDIILKSSDIMARSQWFVDARITRLSCGHIHKPNNHYVGSWGSSWNETGFIPKFNLTEITDSVKITHIPYGTPMRLKITDPSQATDPSIAYWLETADHTAKLPDTVHSWSRVTYSEEITENRRVTADEAEHAKTLYDLAVLMQPDINKNLKPLFDEISEQVAQKITAPANIKIGYVEIAGCDLFKGETVRFNIADLSDGLTNLSGSNGEGKSSLLSFCHPYPHVIGKDTDSGRPSAIHCFFSGRESYIKKTVYKNGEQHNHQINIRGAHTKNPKIECSLSLNGAPQLERGSFDEMAQDCNHIYGNIDEYRITSFYEQPQQSVNQQSGLMSAKKITARDTVLQIAGIDRSREKQYALDKKAYNLKNIIPLEAKISAIEETMPDSSTLGKRTVEVQRLKWTAEEELSNSNSLLAGLLKKIAEITTRADAENKKREDMKNLDAEKTALYEKSYSIKQSINDLNISISNIDKLTVEISQQKSVKKEYSEWADYKTWVMEQNAIDQLVYSNAVQKERDDYNKLSDEIRLKNDTIREDFNSKTDSNKTITAVRSTIENLEFQISEIDSPCEKCGHVKSNIQDRIDMLKKEIARLKPEADKPLHELPDFPEYKPVNDFVIKTLTVPPTEIPDEPEKPLDDFSLSIVEDKLHNALTAKAVLVEKESKLEMINSDIANLDKKIAAIEINYDIEKQLEDIKADEIVFITANNSAQKTFDELKTEHALLKHKSVELGKSKKRITEIKKELGSSKLSADKWGTVADMLQSNKIPALELDMVLDSIDAEATRNILPYRDGVYSYKTQTQEMGKSALVDRFDIMIHDATTGKYRSFFKHSPGEKAFLSDAYIKALIRKRTERSGIEYSPIISDEADSPIETKRVSQYYDVQNNYFNNGQKVLVVSHAPDAHNYIQNSVEIKNLKGVE